MALNPSRSAARLSRNALRACKSQSTASVALRTPISCFSTSPARLSAEPDASTEAEVPRWSRTPERMKAPFSPHIVKDPARSRWKVNSDPKKLDEALTKFFGRDGDRLLPDELKWLAVTHKSFDQGRRGFNDRLAFLGRQIITYEATQSIITAPPTTKETPADAFAEFRTPYEDPALRSLDNLTSTQPRDLFTFDKMAAIAIDSGLTEVVRWKPRMPENLKGSGFSVIMSGAVYALVGAVAQQHGGQVASRIVRERILKKLR